MSIEKPVMMRETDRKERGGAAVWILALTVAAFLLLLLFGGLLFSSRTVSGKASGSTEATLSHAPESSPTAESAPAASAPPRQEGGGAVSEKAARSPAPAVAEAPSLVTRPPSPYTQQLVSGLIQAMNEGAGQTPERAASWKQQFQQLVQQGPEAVPAIAEFLSKNLDYSWAESKGQAGYGSARAAMFGALAQIGGPDALAVLSGVLQSAADPSEVAVLARTLDEVEPGMHRHEALAAAAEALNLAREGKLGEQDVAPLFEVLHKYGDASAAVELENAAKNWNYYSVIALAEMPEGAGIPSLVRLASGETASGGAREGALQMLAQSAAQSDAAREALVQMAKDGKLSAYSWAAIGPYLAGDKVQYAASAYGIPQDQARVSEMRSTHVSTGNQNFYSAPPPEGLSPEQAGQYLALVDALLGATKDPGAVESLSRAKELINKRAIGAGAEPLANGGK